MDLIYQYFFNLAVFSGNNPILMTCIWYLIFGGKNGGLKLLIRSERDESNLS